MVFQFHFCFKKRKDLKTMAKENEKSYFYEGLVLKYCIPLINELSKGSMFLIKFTFSIILEVFLVVISKYREY